MTAKRTALAALALVGATTLPLASCAFRPAIEPAATPARASFEPALVRRGEILEALGDCSGCHTAPGGRAYAGGRRLATPFGAIYSTNITPDRDTGIGRWPEEAFVRAMREGVDREGRRLYPAFPYDHFTHVRDGDLHALYAFLMTRTPVAATKPANELVFPLGFRPLLAAWQLLYLDRQPILDDATRSAAWNRGRYLVEGLGHCGACHTPRNALGAEERERALAGGEAEGWDAPALDRSSPSPIPWTATRVAAYLANEVVPSQGIPAGPMSPVAHNLALVPRHDIEAIATYLASLWGEPSAAQRERAAVVRARIAGDANVPANDADLVAGRAIYGAACAVCHDTGRGAGSGEAMHLAASTSLSLPKPTNLLRIVQDGVAPRDGERGRFMPAFRGTFTDAQLADLVRYLRVAFGNGAPWDEIDGAIRAVREHG
jgi:mono/diheme cytochrome c family protein